MKFEYYGWDDGTSLYHFGILGQKWGIRRWQNPDGSFNEEGKKRYGRVSLSERRLRKFQNPDGSYTDKGKKRNLKQLRNTVGNFSIFSPYAKRYNDAYKNSDVAKNILSSDSAKKYLRNLKTIEENDYELALLEAYERYGDRAKNDARKFFNSSEAAKDREWWGNDFDEFWSSDASYDFYTKYLNNDKHLATVERASNQAYSDNKRIIKEIVRNYYGISNDSDYKQSAEAYIEYLLNDQNKSK